MKPTALVVTTTNWVPTARLALALAEAGFRVEALCPRRHPVNQTEAVSRLHIYRGLAPLRSLARALAAPMPDLIVPGDDLAVRHLQELYRHPQAYAGDRKQLLSLIERSLGPSQSFPITQARAAFMELARAEGIRIPETSIIRTGADVQEWNERVGLPAVFKADETSGGAGVRMVRTVAEAQPAFRKLQAPPLWARAIKRALVDQDSTLIWPALLRHRPEIIAQALVAGHEATSTIVCWQGAVLASLHFEVLRKCNAAGHATVVRLLENSEMSTAVEKLVGRMSLSGICGFDFMLEANTGHAYLIEINPRATQVGHLTLGAGRDLPAALLGAVSGQASVAKPSITENPTVALFPHEWARDPESEFLRNAYHDVPWETPELVHACIRRSRQQRAWYRRDQGQGERAVAAAVNRASERSAAAR